DRFAGPADRRSVCQRSVLEEAAGRTGSGGLPLLAWLRERWYAAAGSSRPLPSGAGGFDRNRSTRSRRVPPRRLSAYLWARGGWGGVNSLSGSSHVRRLEARGPSIVEGFAGSPPP